MNKWCVAVLGTGVDEHRANVPAALFRCDTERRERCRYFANFYIGVCFDIVIVPGSQETKVGSPAPLSNKHRTV